jgi:hypothetical protein
MGVTGSCEEANGTYGSKNKDNTNPKEIHPRCVSGNRIKHQTAIHQTQHTFFTGCIFVFLSQYLKYDDDESA